MPLKATVELWGADAGAATVHFTFKTDGGGTYAFSSLVPGYYVLRATAAIADAGVGEALSYQLGISELEIAPFEGVTANTVVANLGMGYGEPFPSTPLVLSAGQQLAAGPLYSRGYATQIVPSPTRDGLAYAWLPSTQSGAKNVLYYFSASGASAVQLAQDVVPDEVQFFPNGGEVAVVSNEGALQILPVDGGAPLVLKTTSGLNPLSAVEYVGVDPDGSLIWFADTCSGSGTLDCSFYVALTSVLNFKAITQPLLAEGSGADVTGPNVSFSNDGRFLAFVADVGGGMSGMDLMTLDGGTLPNPCTLANNVALGPTHPPVGQPSSGFQFSSDSSLLGFLSTAGLSVVPTATACSIGDAGGVPGSTSCANFLFS